MNIRYPRIGYNRRKRKTKKWEKSSKKERFFRYEKIKKLSALDEYTLKQNQKFDNQKEYLLYIEHWKEKKSRSKHQKLAMQIQIDLISKRRNSITREKKEITESSSSKDIVEYIKLIITYILLHFQKL